MQEGKLDPACDKLAESQRLDPGAGTLLNLADCRERQGRTATAWATWLEAAAAARTAGQAERESLARQRAEALRPRLVTLTIDVPQPSRVAGLTLSRDGVAVGAAVWGSAVPVDPGQHTISASAPGHQSWESSVTVREGNPSSVIVPQLTPSPTVAPQAVVPQATTSPGPASTTPSAQPASPTPSAASASPSGGPPAMVYVSGIVGVIGLGVGTVSGLRAMSKNNESEDHCSTSTLCNSEGKTLRDDAFSAARLSTVGFIVGGVGLAAATVFWITAPKQQASPQTGIRLRRIGAGATASMLKLAVEGAF
jgi:serine/threonine-protein kinase